MLSPKALICTSWYFQTTTFFSNPVLWMGVIGGKWLAVQYRFERSVKVLSLEKVTVSKKMSSVFLKNYFNKGISNLIVAQIRHLSLKYIKLRIHYKSQSFTMIKVHSKIIIQILFNKSFFIKWPSNNCFFNKPWVNCRGKNTFVSTNDMIKSLVGFFTFPVIPKLIWRISLWVILSQLWVNIYCSRSTLMINYDSFILLACIFI